MDKKKINGAIDKMIKDVPVSACPQMMLEDYC